MREFFKMFLASLLALGVMLGGAALVVFLVLAAASAGSGSAQVKDAVVVLDLAVPIQDKPATTSPSEALNKAVSGSHDGEPVQLLDLTRAIKHAAGDPDVKGLLLKGSASAHGYSSGLAALKELREALVEFKKSKKRIFAYSSGYDETGYYVASVADEVVLHPFGDVTINGLASQGLFFAKALEKLGVGVQVTRVGKYKSAVEPFLLDKMSEPNREQTQTLLDDLWTSVLEGVAGSRSLSVKDLQNVADTRGFLLADEAVAAKLVDKTAYFDELLVELKTFTQSEASERTFKQVSMGAYIEAHARQLAGTEGEKLAVVYAEGEIVDGDDEDEVGGDSLARTLRKVRLDDSIKAVVLRVNSPGGSATASEVIRRELCLIMQNKPVMVSMGTVAASGGYWISTCANRIFAEPNTITGSIGVFGVLPNVEKLAGTLGVSVDTVKTGVYADIDSTFRTKSPAELSVIQAVVDRIYSDFLDRVVEARKLERARVEELAQGRVWSGKRALELGLVDELGGLEAAISASAKQANLGEHFKVETVQQKRSAFEQLMESLGDEDEQQHRSSSASRLVELAQREWRTLAHLNDPRGVYARLPFDVIPQ